MSALAGKRVHLVEDEAIIAFAVEDMLADLGCQVVDPAMRLEEATSLAISAAIDAAILDVNLNDLRSYSVAEALERRGVPFVFATGYDQDGLEWDGRSADIIAKPYRREQLEAALLRMLR